MSKLVKELVRKEFIRRFEGLTSLAVVGFSGVDAVANHQIRGRLRAKDIRMTVVKNSLAKQAFKALDMPAAGELLDGPCAIAYGADSVVTVVRELLDMNKEAPNLTVKAALFDGEVFGPERIAELSRYPTRDEAIARVVQRVLSPGGKLTGALAGPSGKLASILKSIEESQGGEAEAA
ncbi:MAG: 50S ribosomal protein L10 [Phycisphaerae bacterium]|nr:50S ribosomal protein L10 [Phycisphaerae bacterium]